MTNLFRWILLTSFQINSLTYHVMWIYVPGLKSSLMSLDVSTLRNNQVSLLYFFSSRESSDWCEFSVKQQKRYKWTFICMMKIMFHPACKMQNNFRDNKSGDSWEARRGLHFFCILLNTCHWTVTIWNWSCREWGISLAKSNCWTCLRAVYVTGIKSSLWIHTWCEQCAFE